MKLCAVAFDMDGLMFDTEALAIQSWIEAGKMFGLELDKTIVLLTLGVDSEGTKRIFQEHYGTGIDYPLLRKKRLDYTIAWIEQNGMPLKPGLLDLLSFLKREGYSASVASSTDRDRVMYYLQKADIVSFFHSIVTGDQVRNGKPAPDIYLRACKEMGSEPGETLALEDSPYGIQSAYRAGCLPVMVPDLAPLTADIRPLLYTKCDSLYQVIELLKKREP